MTRGAIYAGKAAILLTIQDQIDRGLVGVRNKLRMFSNSVGDLGAGALRGGIIGSIGGGFMLKGFMDFSAELTNLQTKLGYFGTLTKEQSKDLQDLSKSIRSLGKSTVFTSKEVAEAATQLAQAGFSAKEIQDSLQSVLDLARGTGFGLAESAGMMANAIRTFNLDTTQATTVVSQFVKATRLGTIEIQDLQEALKYASGSAVNLEQTLPTLLGLFVQMSEAGLKGSLAGTSLNTAMLNLVKNFEDMEKTLDGFQLVRDQKGMLDLIGTLESLYKATEKMDTLKRVGIFQDIFNIRGARAVSSTQEIERVIKFAKEIAAAGNEARLASLTRDTDITGSWKRATSAIDDFGKTLGYVVDKPLQGFLDVIPAVMERLDDLVRRFPLMTLGVLAIPPALAVAGVGLLTLSVIMRKTAGVVDLLLGGFRRLANVATTGTMSQLGFLKANNLFPRSKKKPTSLGQLGAFARGVGSRVHGAASFVSQAADNYKQKALILSQARGFEKRAEALKKNLQYERALLGAMKARGVATPGQIARQASKVRSLGLGVSAAQANAGGLRQTASAMKILPKMNLLSKAGRGLLGLAKGFWAVTRVAARFTFSIGGITTILEMLLLFGDKIPFVAAGMERLGKGFSAAFGEIGKIGKLAVGPLKLIWQGITSLFEGNGANAQAGLDSIIEGFSTLATVIGSQLKAAWERIVIAIAPAYDFIKKIVVSLYQIIALTIKLAASFAGGRFNALGKVLSSAMGGTGGFNSAAEGLVVGIGHFIANFFAGLELMGNIFDDFLYHFQLFMIRMMEMTKAIWPSTANALRAEASTVKMNQDVAAFGRGKTRQEALAEFDKAVHEAFSSNTEAAAKVSLKAAQDRAAEAAKTASSYLGHAEEAQAFFMKGRQAEIEALKLTGTPSVANSIPKQMQEQARAVAHLVKSLVGSAQSTRGNLLAKVETEKEYLKRQTESLDSIDDNTADMARRAGPLVFGS